MRLYETLYDSGQNRWSVIARDDFDTYWFVLVPDLGSRETAQIVVRGLTTDEREGY